MASRKVGLVLGAAGMDGSHLCDFLSEEGYQVIGAIRRNANRDLGNIKHLEKLIDIEEFDITDMSSLLKLIQISRPNEIYNLAAQSHVHTSFNQAPATFNIDAMGVIYLLECLRTLNYNCRLFQASTSELWGDSPPPQNEETIMRPRSPYAVAKLAAHWMCDIYRSAYRLYVVCGITHNHEGWRRGPLFVTRKISLGVAQYIEKGTKLKLGNLSAKRDWGLSPEYVRGFHLSLQQPTADDYVFATNEMHSVQEFVELAFSYAGLKWEDCVEIDRFFMRPIEVEALQGDYSKAKRVLGWEPKVKFDSLVKIMVDWDLCAAGLIAPGDGFEILKELGYGDYST